MEKLATCEWMSDVRPDCPLSVFPPKPPPGGVFRTVDLALLAQAGRHAKRAVPGCV